MRILYCSLLISLLILIQCQGSSGENGTVTTINKLNSVTKIMGEVGAVLNSYEKLDDVAKYNFKSRILPKLLTSVGTHFAPIWGLATLAFGSVEGER